MKNKKLAVRVNGKLQTVHQTPHFFDSIEDKENEGKKSKESVTQISEKENEEKINYNEKDWEQSLLKKYDRKPSKKPFGAFLDKAAGYKKILMVAFSAIFIGVSMGLIMLQFISQMEQGQNEARTIAQEVPTVTNDNNKEETASIETVPFEVTSFNAFVVQAGVFTTQEKAEASLNILKGNGYGGMIWQRENQYYVFIGYANTKEEAKAFAANHLSALNDIYIGKEWSTPNLNLDINKNLIDDLKIYQKQLLAFLNHPTNKENTIDTFKKSNNEDLNALQDNLMETQSKILNDPSNQKHHVEILNRWKEYQAFVKKISD